MDRRNFCKLGATGLGALALSSQTSALEKVVSSPAKKWAIVYGSKCGSSKEYAGFINEGLGGIAEVIDIEVKTPNIGDYDIFIIGGWRSGNTVMPDKIPSFVKNNKTALKDKIKGMFVVLGNNGTPVLNSDMTTFLKNTLITPAGVNQNLGKVFFGRSVKLCNGFDKEYDNVKKEDGVAFGQKILSENKTGILSFSSGINNSLDLSFSRGITSRFSVLNYSLPVAGHVELSICSIHGQKLATLVSQHQNAGFHRVTLGGKCLTPGQYIYRLEAGGLVKTISAAIMQ
jgi:hypothetical protein